MASEQIVSLERLRGKTTLEVISLLPTFPWQIDLGGIKVLDPKITSLTLVGYNTKLHRESKQEADYLYSVPIETGKAIPLGRLRKQIQKQLRPGRTFGITSKVDLDYLVIDSIIQTGAHIPLIDIEVEEDNLLQEELVEKVKKEIKVKTEINQGILLLSGGRNHFHFIGLGRLFTDEQFVTFIGRCLDLDYQGKSIVCPFWAGHSLNPQTQSIEDQKSISAYNSTQRWATLRITSSGVKPKEPTVIDVL